MTTNNTPTNRSQVVQPGTESEKHIITFTPKEGYNQDNVFITDLGNGRLQYYFYHEQVQLIFESIHENRRGLIATLSVACPPSKPILSQIEINLSSQKNRRNLALDLARDYQETSLPWGEILEYAITRTIAQVKAPPELADISQDPLDAKLHYQLEPVLLKGQPNTIFCPGGKGKSIMAAYWAVLTTHGLASPSGLPFIPAETKVLYLDYEAEAEIHRRYVTAIECSLELPHKPIYYMSCDQPLSYYAGHLLELIKQYDIGLVIIDSMMAATAQDTAGLSEAQLASAYYNLLRSLGCTTLTIDHTTKQSMVADDAAALAPYGSVVKYNRSRCQWELKTSQQEDEDTLEIALVHRKFNAGKLHKTIGIRITFINEGDELKGVEFTSCDIADNPTLSKVLPLYIRIKQLLLDEGDMTVTEIATVLETEGMKIRARLNEHKNLFIKLGDKWGVRQDD